MTRPARYLGTHYAQGSQDIYQGINQILNGQSAQSVLPNIASQLNQLVTQIKSQLPGGGH